jgi:hypothetical protein
VCNLIPWFQRFIFIIFIAKGGGKINLWLKAAIDSSSRANQFELGTVHYLWRGVAPKRNVFRGKNFADPTIRKVKNLITQPQISIKK